MTDERCPGCGAHLFERGPDSPPIRLCQDCWWAHERAVYRVDPSLCHPLASAWIERGHP